MSGIQLPTRRSSRRLVNNANSKSTIHIPGNSVEFGPEDEGLTYPEPTPPVSTKSEIFNRENYLEIEQHVKQVPIDAANSYPSLLDFLIGDLNDELAKLWAMFCWLVQQRVPVLLRKKDIPSSDTPVGYLHAIRMCKGTYAQLLATLCRKAGLPCVVIHGIAKGVTYEAGDAIDSSSSSMKSCWNGVFVDGNWRLIHPYWSAMRPHEYKTGLWAIVDGKEFHKAKEDTSSPENKDSPPVNDFYFLTDPEVFVVKCFPYISRWQLLDNTKTRTDFEQELFLQPEYFKLGLEVIEPKSCKVLCIDGKVKIIIKMPEKLKNQLEFDYKIFKKRKNDDEGEYEYPPLGKFLLHYLNKNTSIFEVRFPPVSIGIYKMQIFCTDLSSNSTSNWICDFRLVVKNGMDECIPLPLVPNIGWGAREEHLKKHNMASLSDNNGKMCIDDSLVTTFKFTADPDADIHAELSTLTKSNLELANCVKVEREGSTVFVKVKPPQEGEYALQIFCKDSGTLMYENVSNVLLQRNEVVEEPDMAETRQRLLEAVASGSPQNLQSAIKEFETKGMKDKGEYMKAKRKLLLAKLNNDIREAIADKDLDKLEKTMHNLSETSLKRDLGSIYHDAEELRSRLRKLKRLRHAVLDMDQKTISELRSYPQPPKAVHGVMAAIFLLLGNKEAELKKWNTIQSLISKKGKEGLKRKVGELSISNVKSSNLSRAKSILSKYDLPSVQIASSGAATFYQWATTMIDEFENG